ncbi:MAG TPA: hypothetical protein VHZ03_02890 [Trebonia sp.]|nr:hypothetical protein [Trebonia sp.]
MKQKPGRDLLEFCRDRRADVLRFAADTTTWPTNNLSERGARPLKTQQEISGWLGSDDVTKDRLDIRGYTDTARKHGLNALDVLHQLMLGNPWLPPAQPISRNSAPRSAPPVTRSIGVNAQGKSARLGVAGYFRKNEVRQQEERCAVLPGRTRANSPIRGRPGR